MGSIDHEDMQTIASYGIWYIQLTDQQRAQNQNIVEIQFYWPTYRRQSTNYYYYTKKQCKLRLNTRCLNFDVIQCNISE